MASSDHDNWWKSVPCHFVWNLETDVIWDVGSILNNLDSKLETLRESEWTDSACDLLLFRGYLEVSKFDGVQSDPKRADEFFQEAEKEAMEITNDQERKSCIIVAAANRLWILETLIADEIATSKRRKELLCVLERNWKDYSDEALQNEVQAYIHTIAAFALSKLGPNKYEESKTRYKRAIESVGTGSVKSSWYHTLGLMTSRQARSLGVANGPYQGADEEIRYYERALEIDPANPSARLDLAYVLSRDQTQVDRADDLMRDVPDTTCENIIKKARIYRRMKDNESALRVLKKGEELQNPRSELFYQFALNYKDLAKNRRNTREYMELELKYLDKCLQLEPMHFQALLDKAFYFSRQHMYDRADELYRFVIREFPSPNDHVNSLYKYAGFLSFANNKRMNEDAARAYEDAVEIAISIISNGGGADDGGDWVRRVLLPKSKEQLTAFYQGSANGSVKLRELNEKLSEIGC